MFRISVAAAIVMALGGNAAANSIDAAFSVGVTIVPATPADEVRQTAATSVSTALVLSPVPGPKQN